MKRLINITLELDEEDILGFEYQLKEWIRVKDFTILTDTKKMYNDNSTFRKLVKAVSSAKRIKDLYINEHNGKYANKA